jgi:hypothetical protein
MAPRAMKSAMKVAMKTVKKAVIKKPAKLTAENVKTLKSSSENITDKIRRLQSSVENVAHPQKSAVQVDKFLSELNNHEQQAVWKHFQYARNPAQSGPSFALTFFFTVTVDNERPTN